MPSSVRCFKMILSSSLVLVIFEKQILNLFLYETRPALTLTEVFGGGGTILKVSIISSMSSGRITLPKFVTIPDSRREAILL